MTRHLHADFDPRADPPTAPPPYVVSPRTREAIEHLKSLGASDAAESSPSSSGHAPRPRIGVVADVETLRTFAWYCFAADYEVVTASTLSELAGETRGLPLRLICIDLYTLDHQSGSDLALLTGAFKAVPLLILSQERNAQSDALRAGRTCTVISLPAALADIRRLAAALVHTGRPSKAA